MRKITSLLLAGITLIIGCACVRAADLPATTTTTTNPTIAPTTPVTPPVTKPQLVVLTGKLTNITQPRKAGGVLSATLNTDTTTMKIELAPQTYLDKIGLVLKGDDAVTVTGLEKTNRKDLSLSVAVQVLTLGDKTYQLRDDKGSSLWLPSWRTKKVNGTIKDVTLPGAAATGDAQYISATLTTVTTTLTVLFAPADYMTKIGLTLAAGDTISTEVAYDAHAPQSPMMAITVKSHTVLYTLRDAKTRKGLWDVPAAPTPVAPPPATTPPAGAVPAK